MNGVLSNGLNRRLAVAGARSKTGKRQKARGRRGRWLPTVVIKDIRRLVERLLFVAALAGVFAAGWWSFRELVQVPVGHIEVAGNLQHTSTEKVTEIVRETISSGFFALELKMIKEQLEQLPWVYRASVRRQWPDKLVIRITEQRPIARWGEGNLLNHEGELFAAGQGGNAAPWDHLPALVGPEGAQREMMDRYLSMVEFLAPLDLVVSALVQDSRGGFRVQLASGFSLVLGRGGLEDKIARFSLVYQQQLRGRRETLQTVDLRYSHGMAVRFSDSAQVAAVGDSRMGE